jgi:hypothetical protein
VLRNWKGKNDIHFILHLWLLALILSAKIKITITLFVKAISIGKTVYASLVLDLQNQPQNRVSKQHVEIHGI